MDRYCAGNADKSGMKKRLTGLITIVFLISCAYIFILKRIAGYERRMRKKYEGWYQALVQWGKVRIEGGSLIDYFTENGYRRIAIYGMTPLADFLYEELKKSGVEIRVFIDRDADSCGEPTKVGIDLSGLKGTGDYKDIDAVIVTAFSVLDEVAAELREAGVSAPIISLSEVTSYCFRLLQ